MPRKRRSARNSNSRFQKLFFSRRVGKNLPHSLFFARDVARSLLCDFLEMRPKFLLSLLVTGVLPMVSSFGAPKGTAPAASSPAPGGAFAAPGAGAATSQQAAAYPFVYKQVGYLATTGPVPMRFGPALPGGSDRTPPRIAPVKKPELGRTAEAMGRTEAIESYRSIFGRGIPVPPGSAEGGPVLPPAFLDGLGTGGPARNEVMEFFQQPPPDQDAQKRQNRFLFDPIFQSAPPPVPGAQPQSSATYQKN